MARGLEYRIPQAWFEFSSLNHDSSFDDAMLPLGLRAPNVKLLPVPTQTSSLRIELSSLAILWARHPLCHRSGLKQSVD